MARHIAEACTLALMVTVSARAQSGFSTTTSGQGSSSAGQSASSAAGTETRPATTTFFGDTGIWFVPTGEVVPAGKWSVSGYRRGTNYQQGYTNVGDFAGTFAVGVKDRAEIFGSFLFDTRIDRDSYPLFFDDGTVGGIVDRHPLVNQHWTGDNVGDLYLGVKINLWSEFKQKPAALAIRALLKAPTGKSDVGNGTGKPDFSVDFIASKERKRAEVSGYAGFEARGLPDGVETPSGAFRWGTGVSFPSRSPVRIFGELTGEVPASSSATITSASIVGTDLTRPPTVSATENLTRVTTGVTFQSTKGFFVGVGLGWSLPHQARTAARSDDDPFADYWDWQVRIGYHPGVRVYAVAAPPAPAPGPAPGPAPAAAPTHNLTVRAECNPCTVQVGQTSTVTATAQDSIGCAVTYRWSAPTGTFANAAQRQTIWTAPQQEGTVPVTVTVTCPTDNKTASDAVNISVLRPTVRNYMFEDVHFDFDRYSLRPEATRVLDEAVTAMQQDATLRLTVEGHTCSIGTAEYNLALGERRASSVRDYLVSRGISADRLQTVSYGEERPKYDNAREETRRLNRRAAMVVRLQ